MVREIANESNRNLPEGNLSMMKINSQKLHVSFFVKEHRFFNKAKAESIFRSNCFLPPSKKKCLAFGHRDGSFEGACFEFLCTTFIHGTVERKSSFLRNISEKDSFIGLNKQFVARRGIMTHM